MENNKEKLLKHVEEALELTGMRHFIHKETYELLSYPDDESSIYIDIDLFEDTIQEIAQNQESYIEVEPISSREGYIIMEDFTDTVHNLSKQGALMHALNKPNPFRQFRYALEDIDLLEKWYTYKNNAYRNLAARWVDMFLNEQEDNTKSNSFRYKFS